MLATLLAMVLLLGFTSNLPANAKEQDGLEAISTVENYILYLEEQAKLDERGEYKIFCVNRKFHVKRKTLSW